MKTRRIDARIVLVLLCATLVGVGTAAAADYEISGSVETIELGPIFVVLFDEAGFDDEVPVRAIVIPADESADGAAEFVFAEIPEGEYAIRCFQDLNGNETVDFGRFGPTEPTGFYLESPAIGRAPRFDELAFELRADVTDVVIALQ